MNATLAPGATVHRLDIQVRFGDTDQLGHLNNAVYATYTESARLVFMQALGVPTSSLILARLAMDYRRQARFGEVVCVESSVQRIGRSSVTLYQRVMANGVVAADVESVVVYFDYAEQKPQVIPVEYRVLLESAMAAEPATENNP